MRSTILALHFIVYCYISIWCRPRLSFKLRGRGLASFQDPSYFFVLQVTKWWVGVARVGWCIPCLPSLFYYDYLISLLAIYTYMMVVRSCMLDTVDLTGQWQEKTENQCRKNMGNTGWVYQLSLPMWYIFMFSWSKKSFIIFAELFGCKVFQYSQDMCIM